MKYTLENFALDFTDEMGDGEVNARYEYHFTEPEELVVPHNIRMMDVFRFIEGRDEALAKYINRLRSEIWGYGPRNTELVPMLLEDGLDLVEWSKKYIESLNMAEGMFDWYKKFISGTPAERKTKSKQASKVYNDLSSYIPAMKKEGNENQQLYIAMQKAMVQKAVELYPVLLENNGEYVHALKYTGHMEMIGILKAVAKLVEKAEKNERVED